MGHLLDRAKEVRFRIRDLKSHLMMLQYLRQVTPELVADMESLVRTVAYTGQSNWGGWMAERKWEFSVLLLFRLCA